MTGPSPKIPDAVLRKRTQLVQIYVRAQKRLEKQLSSGNLTDFRRFRIQEQLSQINAIIGALDANLKDALPGLVPAYYRHGADLGSAALNAQGIGTAALNLGNRIHTAAVQAVAEQMAQDLAGMNASMKSTANRILRQTQQALIKERQVNSLIADGLVMGETRRETSARLADALSAKLKGGRLVEINGRRFTPEYYAEIVTRTRTREAVTQGAITRGLEYGIPLFQVSIHDNPCPKCAEYQGKVFSVVPDLGFPMLENAAPFHPNCVLPETEVIAPGLCAAYESWYSGPAIQIRLGNGRTLTATPNHPLLTPETFIRAGDITTETQLIYSPHFGGGERIDRVAVEYCRGARSFQVAANAFHGDGAHMSDEANIRIRTGIESHFSRDFGCIENLAKVTGDPTRRFEPNEVSPAGVRAITSAWSGHVLAVGVLEAQRITYRGPVYDLETESGLYYAEGVVSSNCRHVMLPYVERVLSPERNEAIRRLSNTSGPIPGGAAGYDEMIAQARATGGLRKKQLQGEGRTKQGERVY